MQKLAAEIDKVQKHSFRLSFTIPTSEALAKLRMIHRERTAAEMTRIKRWEANLGELLSALQQGDVSLDSLPLDLRTKLAKVRSALDIDNDEG